MFKATLIGLLTAAFLFAAPTAAFASSGNSQGNSQNSNGKAHQEIVYDTPDEGDNAHPSGKDRSVEHGKSLTQGKSQSDPDDNGKGPERSTGKSDKPVDGNGGIDREDQDGNNGCGNDDDFEDDNEGWCGQKPKNDKPDCSGNDCDPGCENDCDEPCEEDCDEPCDNDCDNPCGEDCETPEDPKDPEVKGATTLPDTGIISNDSLIDALYAFFIALSVLEAGLILSFVTKKLDRV